MKVLKANPLCPDCHGQGRVPEQSIDQDQYLKKGRNRSSPLKSFCECILVQLDEEDRKALASAEGLDLDIISITERSIENVITPQELRNPYWPGYFRDGLD